LSVGGRNVIQPTANEQRPTHKKIPRNYSGDFLLVFSQLIFSQVPIKKEPAIDIAGLCLPLKPQKERSSDIFRYSRFIS